MGQLFVSILVAIWIIAVPVVITLEGVRSWRKHGNLSSDDFFAAVIPLTWICAPFWATSLIYRMSGMKDRVENGSLIRAWDRAYRGELETKIVPALARLTRTDVYGHTRDVPHYYTPRDADPRANPPEPALPSVRRVRQLIALAESRDYVDVEMRDAEFRLNAYQKGVRDARIEQLENELKELA